MFDTEREVFNLDTYRFEYLSDTTSPLATQQDYKLSSPSRLDRRKVKMLLFQQDLIARAKGIHPVDVSRHIQGHGRNPKIQHAIAEALGVSLEKIVLKSGDTLKRRAA